MCGGCENALSGGGKHDRLLRYSLKTLSNVCINEIKVLLLHSLIKKNDEMKTSLLYGLFKKLAIIYLVSKQTPLVNIPKIVQASLRHVATAATL